MLLPHSTSTIDSSFTWTWCRCKTCLCMCHLTVGLLQRCAGWTARVNDCTIAVRVKFCRSSGARPWDHVTVALIDLHWLRVATEIEFILCTLVYQSVTGNAPTYISDMLQPVSGLDRQTILQSASKGDLVVPRTRLKFSEHAPRLWNKLPSDIRTASTLTVRAGIRGKKVDSNIRPLKYSNIRIHTSTHIMFYKK